MTGHTTRRVIRCAVPHPTRRGERGVVAGADGLVFAVLVLLAGSLAVLNIWAVIDTRAALDAAAREYLRAYTQAAGPTEALAAGDAAADRVLSARQAPVRALRIQAPDATAFGPCQPAEVVLSADVPAARLPFLDDVGTRQLRVRHVELVDAHREVTRGPAHDPIATPCGD